MSKDNNLTQCDHCNGTGKRLGTDEKVEQTDKFSVMCPYCSGTGRALKLDAATLTALSLGATKQ